MSFNFNPALSAGEPGVILIITGSPFPQLGLLLISNANPARQIIEADWAFMCDSIKDKTMKETIRLILKNLNM
jgi:hypothetical protein